MERTTERSVIRFHANEFEPTIRFYQRIGFRVAKDIVLVGGARWVVLVKLDNEGIQIHLVPEGQRPPVGHVQPISFELSHADLPGLKAELEASGIEFKSWDCPWAEGIDLRDPIGNGVTLSDFPRSRFD